MAQCATCGSEGIGPGRTCPHCGAIESSGLELDLRARPSQPRPSQPKMQAQEPLTLELAIDPRELVQSRSSPTSAPAWPPVTAASSAVVARAPAAYATVGGAAFHGRGRNPQLTPVDDADYDARVLADLGAPPSSWIEAPRYAWRVLRRQRELRAALGARRAEAEHAATAVEDALVVFAERARAAAEKGKDYAVALEDLQRAEDVLRSRDRVLAAEQDAQRARQQQVADRVAKLEADLLAARDEERVCASELAATQSALAREEAKLKRADAELKAAQQSESRGGGSGAGT